MLAGALGLPRAAPPASALAGKRGALTVACSTGTLQCSRRSAKRPGAAQRERVPFSANVASYLVLEMIRQIVREDWWPATTKLHYSFVPNRLSTAHERCRPHCSFERITAAGDSAPYPFIVDPAAGNGPH